MQALIRMAPLWLAACLLPGLAGANNAPSPPKKKAAASARPAAKKPAPKTAATVQGTQSYAQRADAMTFADDLAERRQLDRDGLRQTLSQARLLPGVPKLMLPPSHPSAKNWQAYRARFVEPIRIGAGLRFWQQHRASLERAEQTFGVPAAIIVGILGVETIYGQHMGNYRVLDALATLAFDFPAAHPRAAERQAYFRSELEHFLAQHQRAGTDPLRPRGSYAGAMGQPQFMPSSWARYAIDFDGDGRIDLFNSADDAIGSVANYFKGYGWQTGLPTHYPVRLDGSAQDKEALLLPDILPTFSVTSFTARGAVLNEAGQRHPGALALIELQNGGAEPSYVAGTENFYVITRYNWSSYYAMAVIELGEAVAQALPR
ncbi:lytic murein transglycosylase B [Curvibacter sp. HBC61]|uniref:Lytic murein transglycosylase B n=1 Tax=Curvibacter cyanobacteriorum TaxID=3026422 RepID=A0ABT5MSI7_9BURK|nr:lytic murein transglycosylase B [Curvibacter sp. HBC61]MDD0837003.1 lytic murein transglycosylase B [Curvibacter sp. HBC61]